MDILSKAASFILVIGVLIFMHELGHFLVARFFGMGVRVFSLGFGPKLLAFSAGQTEYRVCAVPLGGYVQLVAQDSEADDTTAGFPPDTWFIRRPSWQRMLVVAAGPVFNLVLAWVLYSTMFFSYGLFEVPAAVGEVTAQSAAERAGLKTGDAVLSIGGEPISYFRELQAKVEASQGTPLDITVRRGGETLRLTVTPDIVSQKNIFGEEIKKPILGVRSPAESINIPVGPVRAVTEGLKQTWEVTALTGQVFWKLIMGVVPMSSIGGPIMIAELVGKQSEQGLAHLITLTAMISVNLAILNLLPIPVLDGGHILFYTLETVLRRPVSERVRNLTTKIGFVLLMALMLTATANDIIRIFTGGALK